MKGIFELHVLHDRGQDVRLEDLPVFVVSDHGRHVLQRGRGRRSDLVVSHRRPGQRDIQLLPRRKKGLESNSQRYVLEGRQIME